MDDLSLLPEEAREALAECERATAFMFAADSFDTISAELLRLARKDATWLSRWNHAVNRYKRAEAERDALRKRMSSAPTCNVRLHAGFPVIDVHDVVCHDAKYMERWMRVSLVPLDDAEAKG